MKLQENLLSIKLTAHPSRTFNFRSNCVATTNEDGWGLIEGVITYKDEVIGYITAYRSDNDRYFRSRCEKQSNDCAHIASVVTRSNGTLSGKVLAKYVCDWHAEREICILDKIWIEPKYRGIGIGSLILKNFDEMVFLEYEIRTIFVYARAFEEARTLGVDSDEYKNMTETVKQWISHSGRFYHICDNVFTSQDY